MNTSPDEIATQHLRVHADLGRSGEVEELTPTLESLPAAKREGNNSSDLVKKDGVL